MNQRDCLELMVLCYATQMKLIVGSTVLQLKVLTEVDCVVSYQTGDCGTKLAPMIYPDSDILHYNLFKVNKL